MRDVLSPSDLASASRVNKSWLGVTDVPHGGCRLVVPSLRGYREDTILHSALLTHRYVESDKSFETRAEVTAIKCTLKAERR